MADFIGDDLRGSRFERADLSGAEFRNTDLAGARFREVDLSGAVMRGVELANVDISGEIVNVTINGVDIGPLIDAELNKRYPDRAKMRPADPAGFREAWDTVERFWDQTVARARRLPPERLHESVDGEWSFTETLRHLVFATDAWVRRAIGGDPAPWDPLDLPWDGMPPNTPGVPRDREVRPDLDTVLALRRDRMADVRRIVDGLTAASMDDRTTPVEGPGWPRPRSYLVTECLLVVFNEEWEHHLYAERDLAALEARTGTPMDDPYRLDRFVRAQDDAGTYPRALAELHAGRKASHWMWFVFPQVAGLGSSATSRRYAISGRAEARAYLAHPVLGPRLRECARIVADTEGRTAAGIFGGIDAMKLRSSMTLFAAAQPGEPVFAEVLARYFGGVPDDATLARLD